MPKNHNLVFEPAVLCVRTAGHGKRNGSGYFQFDEDDIMFDQHDEKSGLYCRVEIENSELIAMRDFLIEHFPLNANQ